MKRVGLIIIAVLIVAVAGVLFAKGKVRQTAAPQIAAEQVRVPAATKSEGKRHKKIKKAKHNKKQTHNQQ